MFIDGRDSVLSMTDRISARMTEPLRRLEGYWHGLRMRGGIPRRSDIDPRRIERDLEYAFVCERISPGMAKLRVSGAHLSDLMGMDTSGMPLSALVSPDSRGAFAEHLAEFFQEPCVMRIQVAGDDGLGKPAMRGEMLLAPLTSDDGTVDRALGGLVTDGRIGRTPRRFEIISVEKLPFGSSADSTPLKREKTPGLAEDPVPFKPAERAAQKPSKHPYIRLIVSNDD